MPAPFSGGCRCGAIRYECDAEPLMVAYCHCRDCQFASGGPFSTVLLVPRPAVRTSGSEPGAYAVDAESGATVTRKFCSRCGSPLFSELSANPEIFVIKAGTLDDPSWLRPAAHIWTESAQPWAELQADLPKFPKNPQQ